MAYKSIPLKTDLEIEDIFTVHYFEYRSDFHFAGERHDFWEDVYKRQSPRSVRLQ